MKFIQSVILKRVGLVSFFISFISCFSIHSGSPLVLRLGAEKAQVNTATTIKSDEGMIHLKRNIKDRSDYSLDDNPDIVYSVDIPTKDIYTIRTHVNRIEEPSPPASTKFVRLQIDNKRHTRRVVSDSRNYTDHTLGEFDLTEQTKQIKIWLPEGIRLEYIEIEKYIPTEVPLDVKGYIPEIMPPEEHPRLWINTNSLPLIKSRLNKKENKDVWEKLIDSALQEFKFDFSSNQEILQNVELESAAQKKAFYYLMTGDSLIGREAIGLMVDYLSVLEFGNIKHGDITREIGRAIYSSALVYDWCYYLMTDLDKESLYSGMMKLARNMEIGWPPFNESIVTGHGSEAQVNRDLLSMSIAIYNEDPEPYKYCSYQILEHLVPMRKFEYQSIRHNQGVDYGAYRHTWEMYAVWMIYRMSGVRIFDKEMMNNITRYWLYMRLPNGSMFSDGDMFNIPRYNKNFYWRQPEMYLLDYSYMDNPILKGEFEKQGGLPENQILYLLLNDPDLKSDSDLSPLPLSIASKYPLGLLLARTGWDMNKDSNDVIAEIKGGGYNFGNHQHSDAGAIQIYYRGLQVCDLGLYVSYGIPYDFNYNKRSNSHSMMLAVDEQKKSLNDKIINDGGTRFNQRTPKSPEEVQKDSWFGNGTVLSADFGPSKFKPIYNYFKVDLTDAYINDLSNYTRSFCFINLQREDIPAIVILADDMTATKKEFKKYWKINTLNKPVFTDSTIILHNQQDQHIGKTHIDMLYPDNTARGLTFWNSKDSCSVLGHQYRTASSAPEANGYHIVVYPKELEKRSRFLTVFQMTKDDVVPLKINYYETNQMYVVHFDEYLVSMSKSCDFIQSVFSIDIQEKSSVLLADMAPGYWNVSSTDKKINFDFEVNREENTLFFKAEKGEYVICPLENK